MQLVGDTSDIIGCGLLSPGHPAGVPDENLKLLVRDWMLFSSIVHQVRGVSSG